MKNVIRAACVAILVMFIGAVGSVSAGQDNVTLCHAAGLDGTTQYVTITVGYPAAYGPAGHFYENGTPQAGHEEDYLGPCLTPSPSPSASSEPSPEPSPSVNPTPTPPPSAQPSPTVTPSRPPTPTPSLSPTLPPTDTEGEPPVGSPEPTYEDMANILLMWAVLWFAYRVIDHSLRGKDS